MVCYYNSQYGKHKNDGTDALKLAQLSAMNQLPMVHIPNRKVRQKRSLIQYRQRLVKRRTQIKNNIRDILAQTPPNGYVMDDALDALAAAWTASQVVLGKAGALPQNPELDSKGLRMEILCPACYNQ